jgi:ADP-ribose pyrophosphatase YjhB (NUDIX family)
MNWNYCPQCGKQDTLEQPNATLTTCTACGYAFYNNAKGATALAFVKDGQILVSKRGRKTDANYGLYELPGGFIDFRETAQACAVREAKEELGVSVRPEDLRLLDVYHNDYNVAQFNTFTIDVAFLITQWDGEIQADDDVASVSWKPFEFIYDSQFCQKYYGGLDQRIRERIAGTVQ